MDTDGAKSVVAADVTRDDQAVVSALAVLDTVKEIGQGFQGIATTPGTADGITGIHEWIFWQTPTGVRVETDESFAGEPVEADASAMQPLLDRSLSSWLGHLRMATESTA